MLSKLVRLILFSRFSKGGLIALIVITVLISLYSIIPTISKGIHSALPSYYSIVYITAFYILFAYISGFTLMKADLDYLFTLPIDRKKLGIALYISNLIIYLVFIVYLTSFSYNSGLLIISPLLGISLLSLNLTLQEVRTSYKILIIVVVALWLLSPLFGFEYSPTSAAFGYLYESLSVTLPYTVILTIISIRKIGNYDQILMKKVSRTSGIVEHPISFTTSSPFKAILQLKLTYFSVTGRTGFYTFSGNYSMKVVKMNWIILITSALAVVYFIVFRYLLLTSIESLNAGVSIVTSYIAIFSTLFVSMSNLMNERLWLTVPSIGYKFFRYLMIATGVQSLIINIPFAISSFVLSVWNPVFLKIGIALLLYTPLVCMLYTYLLALTIPMQLKDEFNPINIEIRGKNFLMGFVFGIVVIPILFVIFASLLILGISVLILAILSVYLLQDKMISRVISKMTEAGYV
ncbi:hypothetical protein [Sulfurisphaera ohwakuensis]|uniref:hypothetical protein n=1 Tax=Sulfurisphaera ohwakuensis TaxID=69656 RepID=UPI0036F3E891